MTTYTTRALAIEVLGEETKTATRTLRKFLRDDMGEGKAVVGKGGRYALDLTKPQVRALTKRFKAWETEQEAAKVARAAALKALATPKAEPIILTDDSTGEDDEALMENQESDNGPSDEEIAAMLSDDDEYPEGDEPDNIGEDYSI